MKPGAKDGVLPVVIEKVKFLMSNHPPLGIFVIVMIVVGIGAVSKLMNPGREIGDTSNLSDFEGK
jgi:hypothetical protein